MANAPQNGLDKVVATIVPPVSDEQRDRASYAEVWRELVETKAKLASLMNEQRVLHRAFEDLETYCRRHVKRVDAIASRITKARA